MDGSCNGLQHFSALFRDEMGGRSVNLTNNDTPRDVYAEVSDNVGELLVKGSRPAGIQVAQSGLIQPQADEAPHHDVRLRGEEVGLPRSAVR
jgi:hypothetical protein